MTIYALEERYTIDQIFLLYRLAKRDEWREQERAAIQLAMAFKKPIGTGS